LNGGQKYIKKPFISFYRLKKLINIVNGFNTGATGKETLNGFDLNQLLYLCSDPIYTKNEVLIGLYENGPRTGLFQ
jgi:hypothetical protein